jgi:hypothetical protein
VCHDTTSDGHRRRPPGCLVRRVPVETRRHGRRCHQRVVNLWIWGTISLDLQDVTRQRSHTAHDAWLALENHFLSNRKTRTLHIDVTFQSFIQGNLSVNDYCQKMKGFIDYLTDLGVNVTDHVLVLNVMRELNKNFEHLRTIFMHVMPFPSFQKVLDDICLEEIQQGI